MTGYRYMLSENGKGLLELIGREMPDTFHTFFLPYDEWLPFLARHELKQMFHHYNSVIEVPDEFAEKSPKDAYEFICRWSRTSPFARELVALQCTESSRAKQRLLDETQNAFKEETWI